QIRGYRFREFVGDRLAYTNLELRFPLVDELRFPFGSIRQIRGLLFFDAGTAWTQNGFYFDSQTGFFRPFKAYDKDQNLFRDVRASYGLGFSFRMGGLELNWSFAKRLPFLETHISHQCETDFADALDVQPKSAEREAIAGALAECPLVENNDSNWRSDFYITFQPF
ncbi:MAG TPA: BamA/TamA family outer membrane protein, partial [Patescibacteria group bacterium]|nr:BamA/TamA family outer membrane protein [Patescibacteria group bacterium]